MEEKLKLNIEHYRESLKNGGRDGRSEVKQGEFAYRIGSNPPEYSRWRVLNQKQLESGETVGFMSSAKKERIETYFQEFPSIKIEWLFSYGTKEDFEREIPFFTDFSVKDLDWKEIDLSKFNQAIKEK